MDPKNKTDKNDYSILADNSGIKISRHVINCKMRS